MQNVSTFPPHHHQIRSTSAAKANGFIYFILTRKMLSTLLLKFSSLTGVPWPGEPGWLNMFESSWGDRRAGQATSPVVLWLENTRTELSVLLTSVIWWFYLFCVPVCIFLCLSCCFSVLLVSGLYFHSECLISFYPNVHHCTCPFDLLS